jgi:7-carboxy-7-deazaguanine synthase
MSRTDKIPVTEIFGPTIQGEGPVIGKPCWFIRFSGCDYQCRACDSLHAVLPEQIKKNSTVMTTDEIARELIDNMGDIQLCIFTGGNPLLWPLGPIATQLHMAQKTICVETQGSIWKEWVNICDYVVVSPKGPGMGENTNWDELDFFMHNTRALGLYLKVVIMTQVDLDFAEEVSLRYPNIPLFLSVGNPYPPDPSVLIEFDSEGEPMAGISLREHRTSLLTRLGDIITMANDRPNLRRATILPQLHVLIWGNRQGV